MPIAAFLALLAAGCSGGSSPINGPGSPRTAAPSPGTSPSPVGSPTPAATLQDAMTGPWPTVGGAPDDGTFHIDGNWSVPYGGAEPVELLQADATFTGPGKTLQLTVPAGQYEGAEIASDGGWASTSPPGYGYGYYQVTMQTANVGNAGANTGVVNSFFLKGAPCCGVQEIDFEFLSNESWLTTSTGAVHCTIDWPPSGSISQKISLPFNPSQALHTYGILWTPDGTVKFYADGSLIDTESNAGMVLPADGVLIFANAWTGNPNWGGLPPASNAVATYAGVKYWANATSPPT